MDNDLEDWAIMEHLDNDLEDWEWSRSPAIMEHLEWRGSRSPAIISYGKGHLFIKILWFKRRLESKKEHSTTIHSRGHKQNYGYFIIVSDFVIASELFILITLITYEI